MFNSKTVWGAFAFALSAFVTSVGWMPESLVTELVQWAGAFFGVWGVRDAL